MSAFERILDEVAGGKKTVEKTPQHVFCVDRLSRYFPDSCFIHVIREPEANIASLMDAAARYEAFASRFGGEQGLERAVAYWKGAIAMSARMRGRQNHVFLRYEDLACSPLGALQPVATVLGIEVSEDMLTYNIQNITVEREAWKARPNRTIERPTSKAGRLFDQKQLQYIREHTQEVLRHFPSAL